MFLIRIVIGRILGNVQKEFRMETVKPMVLLGSKTLQWRESKIGQILLEAQIFHSMSCGQFYVNYLITPSLLFLPYKTEMKHVTI